MPDAKSSTVVVQRGVYTVARKTVDTEGNTIRETPPQWREDITGGSVIVCPINSETDEPAVRRGIVFRPITGCASRQSRKGAGLPLAELRRHL